MTQPVVTNDNSDTAEQVAEQVQAFLATPLGKRYLQTLSVQYNNLHQEAESEALTPGQKAAKIDRAAGVKFAINWLTDREALRAAEYFAKK